MKPNVHSFLSRRASRRQVLKGLGFGSIGLATAGAVAQISSITNTVNGTNIVSGTNTIGNLTTNTAPGVGNTRINVNATDAAILNFALNLEYLEAEYYTQATTGAGLEAQGIAVSGAGTPGVVTIKANPAVPFVTPAIQQYAEEFAANERAHVVYIRSVLAAGARRTVARPAIDLLNSFTTVARAAGLVGATETFDPFADELSFLLGAFLFEDVGVTAYRGAISQLTSRALASSAAGILGTEAYQAGNVRTKLFEFGAVAEAATQSISDLRDSLDGAADRDQGVAEGGAANIVPTDLNGLVFARSQRQVLNIVYGAVNARSGGFFPSGINTAQANAFHNIGNASQPVTETNVVGTNVVGTNINAVTDTNLINFGVRFNP